MLVGQQNTGPASYGCVMGFVLLVLLGALAATSVEQAFEIHSRDRQIEEGQKTIRILSDALIRSAPSPAPSPYQTPEANNEEPWSEIGPDYQFQI